jgi:hypothetical protein
MHIDRTTSGRILGLMWLANAFARVRASRERTMGIPCVDPW